MCVLMGCGFLVRPAGGLRSRGEGSPSLIFVCKPLGLLGLRRSWIGRRVAWMCVEYMCGCRCAVHVRAGRGVTFCCRLDSMAVAASLCW